MKRQFWLVGIVLLAVLSACRSKSDGPTDTYSSGVISIAADESFEPIIQEEIDVFESLYPLAGIVPRYTTEVEAINLLLKDSVRLAIATRTLTEEEMNSFHSRKFFPREIKLATDGLALIVNRDNPDSLLTVRDFSRILTCEAKDWKDINPNSRLKSIQVVFDNKNSSTVRYTMDSICGGKPLATDNVSALKTNQQVIDFVAKNPAAIGVIGVNWLGNRSDTTNLSFKEEIRQPVPVSNISLSQDCLIIHNDRTLAVSQDNRILDSIDIPDNKTVSQAICHGEYLFISFIEGGCIRYNLENGTSTKLPQLPAKASIFTIYIGSQNILWVGTDGQGILEVYEHTSPFHTVKTDYPVRCFCEEDNGNILAGTKGEGILLLDKQERSVNPYLSTANGLISNSVYTIRKNMSGDIFIGTEGAGINYIPLNSGQVKKLNIPTGFPVFRAVYSILFTHNDSLLWLGTSGYGLIKLSLQRDGKAYKVTDMKQYKSPGPSSPSNNIIYSVIAGYNENELWLGTRGGGINKFDIVSERFRQINEIDSGLSLTNNDVIYLTKGDSTSIWIGTSYGLNRLFPTANPP